MLRITCPSCQAKFQVPESRAGTSGLCSKCKGKIVIPKSQSAVESVEVIDDEDAKVAVTSTPPRPRAKSPATPPPAPVTARSRRPPVPAAYEDDDDEDDDRPSRRRRSRRDDDDDHDDDDDRPRRRRSRGRSRSGQPVNFYAIALMVVAGGWLVSLILGLIVAPVGAMLLMLGGVGLLLAGGLLILVAAFQEDPICGILILFVPFYNLYYLISRFPVVCRWFYLQLIGCVYFASAIMLMAIAPARPPAQVVAQNPPNVRNPPVVPQNNPPDVFNPQPAQPNPVPPNFPANPFDPPVQAITGDPAIDGALAKLTVFDGKEGADQLARMPVNPKHQAVVVERLKDLVIRGQHFGRTSAVDALAVWGTPNEVPFLMTVATDNDIFVKRNAIRALAKMKDERAIPTLVKGLSELGVRTDLERAIPEFGTAAEPEVLNVLSTGDTFVKLSAIKILERIGTQRSLPQLQALRTQPAAWRIQIDSAIAAINARGK